jgi:sulfate adenylyltransferase
MAVTRAGAPINLTCVTHPPAAAAAAMIIDPDQHAELLSLSLTAASWDLRPSQQDDLELLLIGALSPLTGYLTGAEVASVRTGGRLPDGTEAPAALTLEVSAEFAAGVTVGDHVGLRDGEGVLLAMVQVQEKENATLAGPIFGLELPTHHDHRDLRRTVGQVRSEVADRVWRSPLAVVADRALHQPDLDRITAAVQAGEADAVLLLATLAADEALDRAAHVRLQCLQLAAEELKATVPTLVTVLPQPSAALTGGASEAVFLAAVAGMSAASLLSEHSPTEAATAGGPTVVVVPPAEDVTGALIAALAAGTAPADLTGLTPAPIGQAFAAAYPPREQQGLTVFFTGFSGSGKSTVANALVVRLLETGERRTVSLLDGDLVRKHLSAGLTFSRADRDTNVRRIGFVAAEVTAAGGLVVCAPIAPYDNTRRDVRAMVGAGGGFVLVHIATPIEECERRDRKGLYAKARAGLIPEFTGISDPYDVPTDAELSIDTTGTSVSSAVDQVMAYLQAHGWLGHPNG